MAYKKPSVSRWVCPDSEVAILSCKGISSQGILSEDGVPILYLYGDAQVLLPALR